MGRSDRRENRRRSCTGAADPFFKDHEGQQSLVGVLQINDVPPRDMQCFSAVSSVSHSPHSIADQGAGFSTLQGDAVGQNLTMGGGRNGFPSSYPGSRYSADTVTEQVRESVMCSLRYLVLLTPCTAELLMRSGVTQLLNSDYYY